MNNLAMPHFEAPRSFPPVFRADARVLILGSMPGAASLRQQQYYAFARNQFWPLMAELCGFSCALPYEARLAALRNCGIALWDVLASCERDGSADAAIRRPVPNDLPGLLTHLPQLQKILCNGTASGRYLGRFFPELRKKACVLPSTSPAAANLSYAEKREFWHAALMD